MDSTFTQKRICTRATPTGRVTLSELNLIKTVNGKREVQVLADESEFVVALREEFGIVLDQQIA